LEGVSRHGRARSVCRPPARRREDGGVVRRVRDLAQDRLQDLSALQGHWDAGADRPQSPAASPRQPAAHAGRESHRPAEAGVSELGRPQDPGAAEAAAARGGLSGDQHRACGVGPAWLGPAAAATCAAPTHGHDLIAAAGAEWAVVRRLHRRVPARQSPLLLSAHDHRLRQSRNVRQFRRSSFHYAARQ